MEQPDRSHRKTEDITGLEGIADIGQHEIRPAVGHEVPGAQRPEDHRQITEREQCGGRHSGRGGNVVHGGGLSRVLGSGLLRDDQHDGPPPGTPTSAGRLRLRPRLPQSPRPQSAAASSGMETRSRHFKPHRGRPVPGPGHSRQRGRRASAQQRRADRQGDLGAQLVVAGRRTRADDARPRARQPRDERSASSPSAGAASVSI